MSQIDSPSYPPQFHFMNIIPIREYIYLMNIIPIQKYLLSIHEYLNLIMNIYKEYTSEAKVLL